MVCQIFNKLATIYRLCAALEVDPADVMHGITVVCCNSSPEVILNLDEKLPYEVKEKIRTLIAHP